MFNLHPPRRMYITNYWTTSSIENYWLAKHCSGHVYHRGTVQCLKFTTFLWLSQLTCVKRITKFQIFNIFLTCLTIYFVQKYNFPMGVASLTFFGFATLCFHFAIFTTMFVIDQIDEASPWWRRAEPLLSGWRHIHSWKNQPILILSIITYLYCQFHPIRRKFTIGVLKYSYFELFDWQFSSTWDGPSQMTQQAKRDICLLNTWLAWVSMPAQWPLR